MKIDIDEWMQSMRRWIWMNPQRILIFYLMATNRCKIQNS